MSEPDRLGFLKAIANGADRRRLEDIFGWRAVDPLLKQEKRNGCVDLNGNVVRLTQRGRDELSAQKRSRP